MIDIYFEPNYGKLYEKMEDGKCEVFRYSSKLGTIQHIFIKRKIPINIDDKEWYDLVTPYGYGGPLIIESSKESKNLLTQEFNKAFEQYCADNNIVAEFIRFHPIIENHDDFKSIYNVSYVRNTVGTKINCDKDPVQEEFSKSARKSTRRVLNSGVTYRITENPDNIHNFKEIYYSTMDRNNASEYYYFDDDYFNDCLKLFSKNILLIEVLHENKVVAAAFYFSYGKIVHAHLSGTLKDYLHLSPAYVIKYATAIWAKDNNMGLIHYGGGTTNSEHDPLYQFKKKFTRNTEFSFSVGKKIWNNEVYEKLCRYAGVEKNTDFFPSYRCKEYQKL